MQRRLLQYAAFPLLMFVFLHAPVLAQDLQRLIPSKPVPPLNVPVLSNKASGYQSAIELFTRLGPWYNESRVFEELQKNSIRELEKGFAEADRSGQRGVLVKVQVLSTPHEAGPYYQLRGDGATLVGSGPDADAVCFAEKCFGDSLEVPIPAGAALAQGSGYLWVERGPDGQYTRSLYAINSLEGRARQTWLDADTRHAYAQVVKGEAYTAYIDTLSHRLNDREQKKILASMDAQRKEAIAQVARIEEEFASEMQRQARLQSTYNTLKALQGILSVASMLASAESASGEKLGDASDFSSPDAVLEKLKNMADASGSKASEIAVRQTTQRNALGEIETKILEFGAKFEMPVPVPQGTVLLPAP